MKWHFKIICSYDPVHIFTDSKNHTMIDFEITGLVCEAPFIGFDTKKQAEKSGEYEMGEYELSPYDYIVYPYLIIQNEKL